MFGHHWQPGDATIISSTAKADYGGGLGISERTYVVDVRPCDGLPTFRTTINWMYQAAEQSSQEVRRRLEDGETISVLCDPRRQKAKFDESDPRFYKPGFSNKSWEWEPGAEAAWVARQAGNATGSGLQSPQSSGGLDSDAVGRLRTLSELHQNGDLSDEEFTEAKSRIIRGN